MAQYSWYQEFAGQCRRDISGNCEDATSIAVMAWFDDYLSYKFYEITRQFADQIKNESFYISNDILLNRMPFQTKIEKLDELHEISKGFLKEMKQFDSYIRNDD